MHIIKSSKLFIQNFTLSTALQSPLERVAFTTFRLPLKYRFSLNQAKRMSAFRSRFDQLLYEHFYDARYFSIFSFWAANSVFSICTTLSFCCARSAKVRLDSTACSA